MTTNKFGAAASQNTSDESVHVPSTSAVRPLTEAAGKPQKHTIRRHSIISAPKTSLTSSLAMKFWLEYLQEPSRILQAPGKRWPNMVLATWSAPQGHAARWTSDCSRAAEKAGKNNECVWGSFSMHLRLRIHDAWALFQNLCRQHLKAFETLILIQPKSSLNPRIIYQITSKQI